MNINQDGWVSWRDVAGVDGVHVRARRGEDGRYVVTDLYVHGGEITADTLRHVSISRLQAQLNAPVEESLAGMLMAAARAWAANPAPDDALPVAELRARGTCTPRRGYSVRRDPVTRPDGSDGFYRNLALAYREHAADSHTPAKRIAEESGAPVGSVHRWIAEARRRGYLPPGQKGRAG